MSGEGSLFDVPPAAIGRFRVLHQIGAGTSGPVFRAAHPETGAPLAIKLVTLPIPPERAGRVAAEFEWLVSALPAVDGVCPLIDAGSHAGAPYLVSDFAPGDSLDVALKQFGPAAISDLLPRLRILGRALDAASDAGVLHGALHLRDVLVSETTTMLTGLGMWPILGRAGERLPMRRPYRAPELSDAAMTAAGDRFSLAALAYEWMTGRRAPSTFVAGDMTAMPGVDRAALGRIFARALHADPAERYDRCEAFVADLEAVEVEDAAAAGAEKPRAESRARKRGLRAGAASVGLPLDATRDSEADHAGDLEVGPVPPTGEEAAAEVAAGIDLAANEPDEAETAPPSPAAAVTLRPIEADAPPSSPLLREPVLLPAETQSGGARLIAGLVIGAVLGLGAGYALWGRGPALPSVDNDVAVSPPVAGSDTATRAGDRPASEPGGSAAPAAAAPSAPAGSPSTPPPDAPAAAAQPPVAPPVETAAPTTGNLLVRSTPPGAIVFIDGERRGVTPLALQNVDLGTRRVRVQRDGFTSEDRQVNLTRSRPSRSVDVRLTRVAPSARAGAPPPRASAAKTGSLLVESRPTGASILLNGRPVGTTPMTIDDLEPGTYTVQLQLPTYRSTRTSVRVVAGERARAAASLVSAQEPQ